MDNENKERVLFITNKLFVDDTQPEGGVQLCTNDFIKLLQCRYNVKIFSIEFNRSVWFRLKAKIGVDLYEEYDAEKYTDGLAIALKENNIKKAFINLSSATALAKVIKGITSEVKVILCSHGNESGDVLHQSVRFSNLISPLQLLFSSYRLGALLRKELEYRRDYIDLVLSVSEVENSIEKWIGAKRTFMVPRVFSPDFIPWNPKPGRVGFLADVSHYPNYYGLLQLCEALENGTSKERIEIRVVGMPARNLTLLMKRFDFIVATGYLSEEELRKEASTWMYYLNLVFYYSKGVSTKLAKGMNWGLPVISTEAGNRGYFFKEGIIVTCKDAAEMSQIILDRCFNKGKACKDREEVLKAVKAFSSVSLIMEELFPVIESL